MIEAKGHLRSIQRFYDAVSGVYGAVFEPLERFALAKGIRSLNLERDDRVLEVGSGTGGALLDLLARVDLAVPPCAVDVSRAMLLTARRRLTAAGFSRVRFCEGDARLLPFQEQSFDAIFASYVLELLPLADLVVVLGEFARVLRPNGRIAVISLSKRKADSRSAIEMLYRSIPSRIAPYVTGGCRPVILADLVAAAGFVNVTRRFEFGVIPTEFVHATSSRRPHV